MSRLLKKNTFDSSKCVSLLELTLKRIKILRNKRLIIAKQSRDDVAKLLQKGQEANAVARVEHAFREENIAGAYDLLEQYCQLIIKRLSAIKSQQECPPELKEAISSLIYAAPRCGDLQELQKLRDILTLKYGAEYSAAVLELRPECCVNQQIIQKLSSRPPNSDTRLNLLKAIAIEYKIDWNYQKAVAASFKNEETSMQDKQKVSRSPIEVSKGAVSTDGDNEKQTTAASMLQKKQATSATHSADPSKSNNTNSEPRDFLRSNQVSDVAQQPDIRKPAFDSLHRDDGHKSHASAVAQNTIPSTKHNTTPKPREFVGANKKTIVGSPTTVDKEKPYDVPMHQASSKEKESLSAHAEAVSSTMDRATSRQKDFMGASDTGLPTSGSKQNSNSIYVHRDELKGQPIIANPSRNPNSLNEEKEFAGRSHMGTPGFVDKVKPASVVTCQDGLTEKASTALPSTADNKGSRAKAFVNPIQVPDVSVSKSSERRKSELDKSKGQATSTQDIYQSRMVSPKRTPHSILSHENDDTAESLAAKQYMRAHKSYVKADTGEEKEDHRSLENSGINLRPESLAAKQYMRAHKSYVKADTGEEEEDYRSMENSGISLRPKHGAHSSDVDPYARPKQEGKADTGEEEEDYRSMENSGISLRPKHGAHSSDVDPYARPKQEGRMDYKNVSHSYKQGPEPKRTPQAMDGEDDTSSHEYYARDQPKETYYRRGSNALSHEGASISQMSKDREWGGKNAFNSQGRHQVEESSFNYHRNPLTVRELSKGHATRPSAQERDLADLEAATQSAFVSAARAADAAKAAIDMVRTSSMRSKADRKVGDVKASQREGYPKTSLNSGRRDGRTSAEGVPKMMDSDCLSERKSSEGQEIRHAGGFRPIVQGLDAIKDEHERKHYKHLSTHSEMSSVKAEVQVAPRVQKKTVLGSTQDLKPETVFYDTSIRKDQELFNHSNKQEKQQYSLSYTEAHQIQEPDLYDSEMPQYDEYSSYESSEEEPPFYTKGRAATARLRDDAQENKKAALNKGNQSRSPFMEQGSVNFVNKSVHSSAKRNPQQDFSESLSRDAYNPPFDEYEQSNNAPRWSSETPMRSHVSGVNTRKSNGGMASYHQEQQERSSASYGHVDEGAIRWGALVPEGPTRDVSKQRWKLTATEEINAQPSLQAHMRASQHDHPAIATQDPESVTGKNFGISRRSVRSSKPT